MSTPSTQIPAGWYPDPSGGGGSRWWDGTGWTANTLAPNAASAAPGSTPSAPSAPAVQPYSLGGVAVGPGTAPAGTKQYTAWIWLIALLPLLAIIPLPFIDWSAFVETALADPTGTTDPSVVLQQQLALYASPAYLATVVLSWVTIGLTIWFAWLDQRELVRRGVPQPFPWPWAFTALVVGGIVYLIGRSVVVRRRTGSGLAPIWVFVGVMLLSLVIGVVIGVSVVGEFIDAVETTLPNA